MMIVVFGFFLKVGLEALNSREAWTRLEKGVMDDDSVADRRIARLATLDLLADSWVRGAGVGSFRFLFSIYQQHYPSIYSEGGRRLVWEHAHNDILEIAAEQGIAGTVIILAAGIYLALLLVRGAFWRNPLGGCVVLGAMLTLVQAWWDLQDAAIKRTPTITILTV